MSTRQCKKCGKWFVYLTEWPSQSCKACRSRRKRRDPVTVEAHIVHVLPVFPGERVHEESPSCWCGPRQDTEQPRLWIHERRAEA